MIVKYKVSDFAKDLNVSAKKVLDELNAMGSSEMPMMPKMSRVKL